MLFHNNMDKATNMFYLSKNYCASKDNLTSPILENNTTASVVITLHYDTFPYSLSMQQNFASLPAKVTKLWENKRERSENDIVANAAA